MNESHRGDKEMAQTISAQLVIEEIKTFTRTSHLNRMPFEEDGVMFDEPLVQFANGDDQIFTEYQTIIAPTHLTPREVLAKTYNKSPQNMPATLSVISWILPITEKTRKSNRRQRRVPSRSWSYTRSNLYGEKFNVALREHITEFLIQMGYLAVAPVTQPYFKMVTNEKGYYSNWSERHIAYAAGLGTFSLSDGYITERGIAHRCGSVVTNLTLPASPRTATNPYSNCLFYVDASCKACVTRCPAGAITEEGHDKIKCYEYAYARDDLGPLLKKYGVEAAGCGLCQVNLPCEFKNPTKALKKKTM